MNMTSTSIDQQFIEYIVRSLVGNPDAVVVDRRIDEKGVLLELTVDPEDLGRVIGKRGATAQSLRTLLRALGTKNDARYNLKIVDNGVADESRGYDESRRDGSAASDPIATGTQDATGSATSNNTDDDDLFGSAASRSSSDSDRDDSRVSKARKELEELDDLDV
jgi:hypothetical protein